MAITVESFDMAPGFFLGGSVADDPHDLARGDKLCRQAEDSAPELPASGVEGTPQEAREACKVLDCRRPGTPHIGRHGVAVTGQGPAAGQGGEGVPRRCGQDTLKQRHHHSAKG